jgi:hypothetical protein
MFDVWAHYLGQTAYLTVRCMNALYRLQAVRAEAMSQLMGLVESTKITLDNCNAQKLLEEKNIYNKNLDFFTFRNN